MRKVALTLMLAVGTWSEAAAQVSYVNGNELLEHCSATPANPQYAYSIGFCRAYVASVADIMGHHKLDWRACIPRGVRMSQLSDVVAKHLRDYPADRHLLAAGLAARALSIAFPCGR